MELETEVHVDDYANIGRSLEPLEMAKVYFFKNLDTADRNPIIYKVRKDSVLPEILEIVAEGYSPLKSRLFFRICEYSGHIDSEN